MAVDPGAGGFGPGEGGVPGTADELSGRRPAPGEAAAANHGAGALAGGGVGAGCAGDRREPARLDAAGAGLVRRGRAPGPLEPRPEPGPLAGRAEPDLCRERIQL